MDRTKQPSGVANNGSHNAIKQDGDALEKSSTAAGHIGDDNFVNEYAEASQAREFGRSPRPIERPQTSRPNSRSAPDQREEVSTTESPETENQNQGADADLEESVGRAPPPPVDHAKLTAPFVIPRLMTVAEVAEYTRLSITKVWRRGGNDPDFPQPIKIGGSTRWDRLEVDRYVEACKARRQNGR